MTLATLRAGLKTAITSNSVYSVVDFGAEFVTTPSIMILSADPWLEPVTMGNNKAWRVRSTRNNGWNCFTIDSTILADTIRFEPKDTTGEYQ